MQGDQHIGARVDMRTKLAIQRYAQQRRWSSAEYIRNAIEVALEADRRDGDAA